MRSFSELLKESGESHGHLCPGQILGVRMAILGCELVGVDEPKRGKQLIVFTEIDRCVTDAMQSVTGCKLGKRTLKYLDYGKVAATFLNTASGVAFRVLARDDSRDGVWKYSPPETEKKAAQLHAYKIMPDNELFRVTSVRVDLSPFDMPGHPISRVSCDKCGESINDGREVARFNETLCRACANGAYYRVAEKGVMLEV